MKKRNRLVACALLLTFMFTAMASAGGLAAGRTWLSEREGSSLLRNGSDPGSATPTATPLEKDYVLGSNSTLTTWATPGNLSAAEAQKAGITAEFEWRWSRSAIDAASFSRAATFTVSAKDTNVTQTGSLLVKPGSNMEYSSNSVLPLTPVDTKDWSVSSTYYVSCRVTYFEGGVESTAYASEIQPFIINTKAAELAGEVTFSPSLVVTGTVYAGDITIKITRPSNADKPGEGYRYEFAELTEDGLLQPLSRLQSVSTNGTVTLGPSQISRIQGAAAGTKFGVIVTAPEKDGSSLSANLQGLLEVIQPQRLTTTESFTGQVGSVPLQASITMNADGPLPGAGRIVRVLNGDGNIVTLFRGVLNDAEDGGNPSVTITPNGATVPSTFTEYTVEVITPTDPVTVVATGKFSIGPVVILTANGEFGGNAGEPIQGGPLILEAETPFVCNQPRVTVSSDGVSADDMFELELQENEDGQYVGVQVTPSASAVCPEELTEYTVQVQNAAGTSAAIGTFVVSPARKPSALQADSDFTGTTGQRVTGQITLTAAEAIQNARTAVRILKGTGENAVVTSDFSGTFANVSVGESSVGRVTVIPTPGAAPVYPAEEEIYTVEVLGSDGVSVIADGTFLVGPAGQLAIEKKPDAVQSVVTLTSEGGSLGNIVLTGSVQTPPVVDWFRGSQASGAPLTNNTAGITVREPLVSRGQFTQQPELIFDADYRLSGMTQFTCRITPQNVSQNIANGWMNPAEMGATGAAGSVLITYTVYPSTGGALTIARPTQTELEVAMKVSGATLGPIVLGGSITMAPKVEWFAGSEAAGTPLATDHNLDMTVVSPEYSGSVWSQQPALVLGPGYALTTEQTFTCRITPAGGRINGWQDLSQAGATSAGSPISITYTVRPVAGIPYLRAELGAKTTYILGSIDAVNVVAQLQQNDATLAPAMASYNTTWKVVEKNGVDVTSRVAGEPFIDNSGLSSTLPIGGPEHEQALTVANSPYTATCTYSYGNKQTSVSFTINVVAAPASMASLQTPASVPEGQPGGTVQIQVPWRGSSPANMRDYAVQTVPTSVTDPATPDLTLQLGTAGAAGTLQIPEDAASPTQYTYDVILTSGTQAQPAVRLVVLVANRTIELSSNTQVPVNTPVTVTATLAGWAEPSVEWNANGCGDPAAEDITSDEENQVFKATFTPTSEGTLTVQIVATDKDGTTREAARTIQVGSGSGPDEPTEPTGTTSASNSTIPWPPSSGMPSASASSSASVRPSGSSGPSASASASVAPSGSASATASSSISPISPAPGAPTTVSITTVPGVQGDLLVGLPISVPATEYPADTLSMFISIPDGTYLELLDAEGRIITGDRSILLSTGQEVRVLSGNGLLLAEAKIVVMGDVLGTGRLSIAQLVRLAKACIGERDLSGVYLMAGDFQENRFIDIADVAREANMIVERLH